MEHRLGKNNIIHEMRFVIHIHYRSLFWNDSLYITESAMGVCIHVSCGNVNKLFRDNHSNISKFSILTIVRLLVTLQLPIGS